MSKNKGNKDADGSPPGTAVDFLFRTMIEREGAPGKRRIRPKNVDELLQADIQELGSDEDPDFDCSFDKNADESDLSINSDEESDESASSNEAEASETEQKNPNSNNIVANTVAGMDLDDSEDEDDHSYRAGSGVNENTSSDSSDEPDGSSDSESEAENTSNQSPVQKKSALRDTLQKLNDAADSFAASSRKKKRKKPKKVTAGGSGDTSGKAAGKGSASRKTSGSKGKGKNSSRGTGKSSKGKDAGGDSSRSKRRSKKESKRTIIDSCFSMDKNMKENRKEIIDLGNPICSACLGSASNHQNEIVECDSCGITVHEGCYGVSDNLSVSSVGSSSSTEPWFCDLCKNGAKDISCELCPMKGGLFKETTAGRWVHLVCSLYTPGVSIGENGLPNLFAVPYARYGAHACSVCDDIRYTRTGVCIGCDAGMCKAHLHATCAQKQGLLSDPIVAFEAAETGEADPYYATCKLHTNRETSKRRAKSYAILQEQLRIKQEQKSVENLSEVELNNQQRIKRKLERIRFKVAIKQAHKSIVPQPFGNSSHANSQGNLFQYSSDDNPATDENCDNNFQQLQLVPWSEGVKKSRLLSTSAGSASSFVHKAHLMGLSIPSLELEDKNTRIVSSVKRKWNVLPSLSVEFAAYYADREIRVTNLYDQCERLEKENDVLNDQQSIQQTNYDFALVNNDAMAEDTERIRQELFGISDVIKSILSPGSNRKLVTKLNTLVGSTKGEGRKRSASSQSKGGGRSSPTKLIPGKKGSGKRGNSSPTCSSEGRLAIATCAICKKIEDQHMITRCDHCKQHYHLKCLDPPLTRMPKRSRLCGWMCSDCGEEEPEGEEPEVDTEAPRTLRGRTKLRKPGKYRFSTDSREGDTPKSKSTPNPTAHQNGDARSIKSEVPSHTSTPSVSPMRVPTTPSLPATEGQYNTANKVSKKGTNSKAASAQKTPKTSPSSQCKPKKEPKETAVKRKPAKQRKSSKSPVASASPMTSPILSPPVLCLSASPPSCPSSTVNVLGSQENFNNGSAFDFNLSSPKKEFTAASTSSLLENLSSVVAQIPLPSGTSNSNMNLQTHKAKRPRKPKEPGMEPKSKKSKKATVQTTPSESSGGSQINALTSSNCAGEEQYKFTDSSPDKNESIVKGYKSKKSAKRKMPSLSNEEEITPTKSKKRKTAQDESGTLESKSNQPVKQKRTPKPKQVKVEVLPPSSKTTSEGGVEVKPDVSMSDKSLSEAFVDTKVLKSPKKPRKKKGDIPLAADESPAKESAPNGIAKKSKSKKKKSEASVPFGGMKLDLSNIFDNGGNPDVVALAVSNLTGAMNGGLRKKPKKKKISMEENSVSIKAEGKAKSSPKKRKPKQAEVTPSPDAARAGTHSNAPGGNQYDDIIEQVARGAANESSGGLNGSVNNSVSSAGILMQGVAPNKPQWQNKIEGDEDNSIMKGHAMTNSTAADSLVTVDLNELINCTETPGGVAPGGQTYTPGFYSSAPISPVPNSTTLVSANPGLVHSHTFSSGIASVSLPHVHNPLAGSSGSGSNNGGNGWGMQQTFSPASTNQNVIKLHYESSLSQQNSGASNYSNPPPVTPVPPPAPPPAPVTSLTSAYNGKCATCNKEDYKKYMVTCDKCIQDFHFMCLNPPLKYSPRRRGYSWYCVNCDEEESPAKENGLHS